MKPQTPHSPGRFVLTATRVWLPVVIAGVGVVLIILGHASLSDSAGSHPLEAGTGVALLIVAVIVWMVNWLFRMSIESNRERDAEEQAREYFDRHGHWPDEGPR